MTKTAIARTRRRPAAELDPAIQVTKAAIAITATIPLISTEAEYQEILVSQVTLPDGGWFF
jgi:hypothetical protein